MIQKPIKYTVNINITFSIKSGQEKPTFYCQAILPLISAPSLPPSVKKNRSQTPIMKTNALFGQ